MIKLKRYGENPIISPGKFPWNKRAVFNPTAILDNQENINIFYRAISTKEYSENNFGTDYVSVIGLAISKNGFDVDQEFDEPVLKPEFFFESAGIEDPRIVEIDGKYIITYTGLSFEYQDKEKNKQIYKKYKKLENEKENYSNYDEINKDKRFIRVCLATSNDLRNFEKKGVILPNESNKNAFLFPKKINGKYVMIHRRHPNIWISFSDDLIHWNNNKEIIKIKENSWKEIKVGGSCPPLKTELGWILFFHGVDKNRVYRIGVVLLDENDPTKVIKELDYFVFEPKEEYEKIGDVNNVVFPCGIVEKSGNLLLYYGGADKYVGVAYIDKKEFLEEFLKKEEIKNENNPS